MHSSGEVCKNQFPEDSASIFSSGAAKEFSEEFLLQKIMINKKETDALNYFGAQLQNLRFARQSKLIVLIKIVHIF